MEFWNRMRRLEHSISSKVDGIVSRGLQPSPREPLAVMLTIVDAVDEQMQHAGRGRRVFPFNRVRVTIAAGGPDERARFEAVFAENPSLEQRIAERLTASGCDASRLVTSVSFVSEPGEHWPDPQYHVEFARVHDASDTEPAAAAGRSLSLTVTAGAAERETFTFTETRINVGRCAEVLDRRQRLLRVNHVAFRDDAEPRNAGVSRRHAHIVRDAAGGYYVIDDHSARGTYVLRGGRTIDVPAGGRGLRLQSGDELVVADARLMVEIGDA